MSKREDSLDRYQLGRSLGAGGQGNVYEYHCDSRGELLAVKVMEWNWDGSNRFDIIKEAMVSTLTKHENVIRALEVFTYDDGVAILMPLFPHGHLGAIAPQLDWAQRKEAIRQILRGLCYMHAQNQIHRDIKPRSIHPIHVVIADPGLASVANPITICGTPGFMAPEICAAREEQTYVPFTNVVDVYSLGIVVLKLIDLDLDPTPVTNKKLYHEKVGGVVHEHVVQWQDLDRRGALMVADRMLAFDPKLRPSAANCLEMPWLNTFHYVPFSAIPKSLRDYECFEIETRPSNNPIQALVMETFFSRIEGWPDRREQIALVLSQLSTRNFTKRDRSLEAQLADLLSQLPRCDIMQDRYSEPLGSRLFKCCGGYYGILKNYAKESANQETFKRFLELLINHPIMVASRPSASSITLHTAAEWGIFGRTGRVEDSVPEAPAGKAAKGNGRKTRSEPALDSQVDDTQMSPVRQKNTRAQQPGGIQTRLRSRQNLNHSDRMDIDN
ncbi:MAG: serine/threonine protein kinase [Ramalina farinacea]|uniref:Serine/threonine protein kinase n=1 Tax=Ramalina farinacea TaxID=258253 RepID=A0AA43TYT1_9LECA|nr:serine/threonine protein kinase [Ramalina farinacea]